MWVKSTHLEWKDGPHGKAGIVCQDCHMPPAAGPQREDGERSCPTCASTCSTARTIRASWAA